MATALHPPVVILNFTNLFALLLSFETKIIIYLYYFFRNTHLEGITLNHLATGTFHDNEMHCI